MIKTSMSGQEIDRVLKAILDAMTVDNNGKVAYIKNGELVFENGNSVFNILEMR